MIFSVLVICAAGAGILYAIVAGTMGDQCKWGHSGVRLQECGFAPDGPVCGVETAEIDPYPGEIISTEYVRLDRVTAMNETTKRSVWEGSEQRFGCEKLILSKHDGRGGSAYGWKCQRVECLDAQCQEIKPKCK